MCFKPRPRSGTKKILAGVKSEPNFVVTKFHRGVGLLIPKCNSNPMGLCYNYKQASRGETTPGLGSGGNVFCGIFITKAGGGRGHNTPFSRGQAFFSRVVKIFCKGQTPPGDREYNLNVSRSSPEKGSHGVKILPRSATD